MTTTPIQPSSSDNFILNSSATTNYGTADLVAVGTDSGGSVMRILVKWDHATIPSSDICDSATISLYLKGDYATNACTWKAYRLLRNWGEETSTWNKYDGTNDWATAGGMGAGDINATELGTSANIPENSAVNTEITISLDVTEFKKMYDGTYTNYGFLIKATNEAVQNAWHVYSREHATAGTKPKLVAVTHSVSTFVPRITMF